MNPTLGVFDGGQLLDGPKRSRRSPDSFWVTFDSAGRARYSQGAPPEGLPHGPFETRAKAKKYVEGLS